METSYDVGGSITRVRPPSDGRRGLVQVGFLLKDTLNVFEVDGKHYRLAMNQCCYGQKIISMRSAQVDDMGYVLDAVNAALLEMHMNFHSEEAEYHRVATIIPELVESTRRSNPSFGTVSLEIRIDSVTNKRSDDGLVEPTGEHGYERLLQRRSENCAVCRCGFNVPKDLVVTTCHHAFHRACIVQYLHSRSCFFQYLHNRSRFFQYLHNRSRSCPVCQCNLAPMITRGLMPFD